MFSKLNIDKPEPVIRERIRRRKIPYKIPEINDYGNIGNGDVHSKMNTEKNETTIVVGSLWTDEDLSELSQMVNKFPAGTSDRWQKIAKAMQRPVPEVTFMANKIKQSGYKLPTSDSTDSTSVDSAVTDEHKKIKVKTLENLEAGDSAWTQLQQKSLENALIKYPKGVTENRWEKIAKCVPKKTKVCTNICSKYS